MHTVDTVLPEYQNPQVGDTIGFGAIACGSGGSKTENVLSWRSEDGTWVWTFVLEAHDGNTRLISRNRFGSDVRNAHRDAGGGAWLAGVGSKMLLGTNSARRSSRQPRPTLAAAGWLTSRSSPSSLCTSFRIR